MIIVLLVSTGAHLLGAGTSVKAPGHFLTAYLTLQAIKYHNAPCIYRQRFDLVEVLRRSREYYYYLRAGT